MKIRAAVLEEFGQPLVVQELDLAEPKAGEVLVRLAACGVCHTDLYTASGADPSGYAPCVLGHEGAGVVERVGDGRHARRAGRPRRDAVRARVRRVRPLPQRADEPLRRDPRPAGARLPPGRHDAPLPRRRADAPLHGHVDVRRVHGDAGDRAREGLARGAARGLRAVRLRARDGDRRGALHGATSSPGSTCVVFGCGLVGLGAVIGCRLAGAERIVAIDLSEEPPRQARHHGATDTRVAGEDTSTGSARRRAASAPTTRSRRPGNVHVMRQAVEAAREAWGLATMVGVAGKGETLDIVPRLLITGRRVTGSSFGGVKGRTQVPQLVDRWLAGEIDVESLLSHRLTLDEVNRGFELMEAQDGIRSVIVFDVSVNALASSARGASTLTPACGR